MKKLLSIMTMAILVISILPVIMAASVGSGITPNIETEDFPPQVFMCDSRAVLDDNTEPGRLCNPNPTCTQADCTVNPTATCCQIPGCNWTQSVSSYNLDGKYLWERINNYAFEGEKIVWDVLVVDKNGIEKVVDVFATIGDTQGAGNDIEVNCILDTPVRYFGPGDSRNTDLSRCHNFRIEGEEQDWIPSDNVAALYKCILTVETSESMYGQYWITVEAVDLDGLSGTMAENEYWFFNPVIALSIDGDMSFENVRPGTLAYSSTMLVGNDADDSSGVMLDMFISGTDFYDSSSSGAKCPTTNQLSLSSFTYFATNGAYSTQKINQGGETRGDAQGYVPIKYGIGFNNPNPFYNNNEIIQTTQARYGPYFVGNTLAPGAEIAITFRLDLPEPCNGDFDTGSIYFWGEAI